MTTKVSGPLKFVTDEEIPDVRVQLRAVDVRPYSGGGLMDFPTSVDVDAGVVTFNCVPGPALLSVTQVRSPTEIIPLLVPDGPEATLEACMRGALMADDFTVSELEKLAQSIAGDVAEAGEIANRLGGIDRVVKTADRLEEYAVSVTVGAKVVESAEKIVVTGVRDVAEARQAVDGYRQQVTKSAESVEQLATATEKFSAQAVEAERVTRERAKDAEIALQQVTPTAEKAIAAYIGSDRTVYDAAEAAVAPIAQGVVDKATDSIRWTRGLLAERTDLNTVIVSGFYRVERYSIAESLLNRPTLASAVNPCAIEVKALSNGQIEQIWSTLPGAAVTAPVMRRRRDNENKWTGWEVYNDISPEKEKFLIEQIGAAAWRRSALVAKQDLNDVRADGLYRVPTYTVAESLVNRPTLKTAVNPALLEVKSLVSGQVEQVWTTLPAQEVEAPILRRRRDNGGAWSVWESSSEARKIAQQNDDLNLYITDMSVQIRSYATANTLVNSPKKLFPLAIQRAVLDVVLVNGHVLQSWRSLPTAKVPSVFVQRWRDSEAVWSEWSEVSANGSAVEPFDPLVAVDRASRASAGEVQGTRAVLSALLGEPAPIWSWWAKPIRELTIPTHDGGGQAVHPSVLYFPEKWQGWEYWMAMTPYPNFSERHEDPNILVSRDGETWQVPVGLTNPLDDAPGKPGYHNSDTHLCLWGDTMICTWRAVDRPNGGQNIILARTSKDGINWTPGVEVLKVPLGSRESTFVAQSLVKMPTGWRLYGIRSMYRPFRLGYYETSVNDRLPITADWAEPKDCPVTGVIAGIDMWHSDVQRLADDDWLTIVSTGNPGSTGVDGDLYLGRSKDGINWELSSLPLTPRASGALDSLYKTGFVVSGTGVSRSLDLFVSGYRTDKRTWGIGRTTATANLGQGESPTLRSVDSRVAAVEKVAELKADKASIAGLPLHLTGTGFPEGKVAAPVGSIYTDSEVTNGAVRWIKTSGVGSIGWRIESGNTGVRRIEAVAGATIKSGDVLIRRVNDTVTYTLNDVVVADENLAKTNIGVTRIPDGVKPTVKVRAPLYTGISPQSVASFNISALGYINLYKLSSETQALSGTVSYNTVQTWPTTLPGTPV